jgi:hypothetical protein
MNKLSIAGGLFTLGAVALSGQVMAACTGTPVNAADHLPGKTVCMQKYENWTDSLTNKKKVLAGYQEEHLSNGELWDYKQGNNPPSTPFPNPPSADPRKQVGTWRINNDGEVIYNYLGGSDNYTYKLYDLGSGNYCLEGNGETLQVIVQSGTGSKCNSPGPINGS